MGAREWVKLIVLSVLWGGSFFFIGVAVSELQPLTIVVSRVLLAAVVLWCIALMMGERFPMCWRVWVAFLGMGLLNNVLPFTLIVWGQTQIASGLASILNATTPIFTVIVAGMLLSDERITPLKMVGVVIGYIGMGAMISVPWVMQAMHNLFKGDLIIFSRIPAMLELQQEMDRLIQAHFGERSSLSDMFRSDLQGFVAEMTLLQTSFYKAARMRDLFKDALAQSGMSIQHNYADKLFLRCVPPTRDSNSQFRGSIGHHRDTWGSNIQHQINWWSPIYPISNGNTLTFYPHYWSTPVVNTTADWSFEAFRKARQQAQAISANAQIDYPYAPQAVETVSDEGVNILLDPGDLLCFSSAHLHGSSAEPRTGFRFNLEMRSFGEKDIDRDSPPENVDNAQSQPNYHWFNRISDGGKYSQ